MKRSAWCQAGILVTLVYVGCCGMAHHAALRRVQDFAAENHVNVVRMGALPVPPSLLDWGERRYARTWRIPGCASICATRRISFLFRPGFPAEPVHRDGARAAGSELYWTFARYPTMIHYFAEDGYHIVDFSEHRFTNGKRRTPQPFSYRVGR